jgi:hypothetical protein
VDVDWSWRQFCIGNDIGQTYVWAHGRAGTPVGQQTEPAVRVAAKDRRQSDRRAGRRQEPASRDRSRRGRVLAVNTMKSGGTAPASHRPSARPDHRPPRPPRSGPRGLAVEPP